MDQDFFFFKWNKQEDKHNSHAHCVGLVKAISVTTAWRATTNSPVTPVSCLDPVFMFWLLLFILSSFFFTSAALWPNKPLFRRDSKSFKPARVVCYLWPPVSSHCWPHSDWWETSTPTGSSICLWPSPSWITSFTCKLQTRYQGLLEKVVEMGPFFKKKTRKKHANLRQTAVLQMLQQFDLDVWDWKTWIHWSKTASCSNKNSPHIGKKKNENAKSGSCIWCKMMQWVFFSNEYDTFKTT